MAKFKPNTLVIQDRDLDLLEFIWRWKVATTRVIGERLFASSSMDAAYNRLTMLKNSKHLQLVSLDTLGNRFVWILTPKGFRSLRTRIPDLREDGFRSECWEHDLYVLAVHLGDWLCQLPNGVELFTEQELRRLPLDRYPTWVPQTEFHRPDGYWRIPYKGDALTMALEVELNAKDRARYERVGRFYFDKKNVFRVIWIAPSLGEAKTIQKHFKNVAPNDYLIHDFVTRRDFEACSWQAKISLGQEAGKSLAFVLGISEPEPPLVPPRTPKPSSFLDCRKYPINRRRSASKPETSFGNRMDPRSISLPIDDNSIPPTSNPPTSFTQSKQTQEKETYL